MSAYSQKRTFDIRRGAVSRTSRLLVVRAAMDFFRFTHMIPVLCQSTGIEAESFLLDLPSCDNFAVYYHERWGRSRECITWVYYWRTACVHFNDPRGTVTRRAPNGSHVLRGHRHRRHSVKRGEPVARPQAENHLGQIPPIPFDPLGRTRQGVACAEQSAV